MLILGKLWSALNALTAAIHSMADTVNGINDELRHHVGLTGPISTPVAIDVADPPALALGNGRARRVKQKVE